MDALGALAPGRGVDVDLALERIVRVGEPELAFAAAEQRLEDPRKLAWTAVKVSRNMVRAVPSISRMAWMSD